jgi:selenocysteine lyase/cysteine desulfurase
MLEGETLSDRTTPASTAKLDNNATVGPVGLVAITHIPTNNGIVMDVEGVGALTKEFDVLYLLVLLSLDILIDTSSLYFRVTQAINSILTEYPLQDACQSVGQMPVNVQAIGCDMLSATGRKYLRGPRGTGFLYVRSEILDELLEPPAIDHYG